MATPTGRGGEHWRRTTRAGQDRRVVSSLRVARSRGPDRPHIQKARSRSWALPSSRCDSAASRRPAARSLWARSARALACSRRRPVWRTEELLAPPHQGDGAIAWSPMCAPGCSLASACPLACRGPASTRGQLVSRTDLARMSAANGDERAPPHPIAAVARSNRFTPLPGCSCIAIAISTPHLDRSQEGSSS